MRQPSWGVAFVMRMRQAQAETAGVRDDGRYPSHALLGGDPGRDEQLAQIFLNMRTAMKVSRETIARRLATTASTIESFESGAVSALPHWKETGRIVRGYCELMRIDPEPILWHIRSRLQALASHARPVRAAAPTEVTASRPSTQSRRRGTSVQAPARSPRRRRRTRALFALSAPLALAALLVYFAQAAPLPVYRASSLLPSALGNAVRGGLDYLMLLSAPRRDGLRWIDVSDPRVRKADKLQSGVR
jgi:hypothetical protein